MRETRKTRSPHAGRRWTALACSALATAVLVGGGSAYAIGAGVGRQSQSAQAAGKAMLAPEAESVWDGTADTSWYNVTATTFTLSTPQQLAGLAQIASGTAEGIARDSFAGKTVRLAADMQLNADAAATAKSWKPIADVNTDAKGGTADVYFDGTFDGQGHKVANIYINGLANASSRDDFGGYQGLFGALGAHAVVENVGIESGSLSGRVVGGIAAVSHVENADEVPRIIACYNKATIHGNGSTSRGTGGIFGGEDQYGAESAKSADSYRAAAFISDCYNRGAISASGPAGGIAGTGSLQIHGCYNTGDVTSSTGGSAVGALAANVFTNVTANGFRAKSGISYSVALAGSSVNLLRFLPERSVDIVKPPSQSFGDEYYVNNVGFTGANGIKNNNTMSASTPMLPPATVYLYDSANSENDGYPLLYWQVEDKRQVDIASASVKVVASVYYTGAAQLPQVAVETTPPEGDAADELIEGVDYYVVYRSNTGVGTGYVDVYGIGRYSGEHASMPFRIVQVDLSKCSIRAIDPQWCYGDKVEPKVVILDERGRETDLEAGHDYTVSYEGNDRDGVATVTATGNGRATSGSVSAQFQVSMAADSFAGGAGTKEDPYRIATKGQLQYLAHLVNTDAKDVANGGLFATKCYKVTADIDARATESQRAVDSIGVGTDKGFAGTFDGDGHKVEIGLSAESLSPELDFWAGNAGLGFFANTNSAGTTTIKNLTLAGTVQSSYMVGAFVGNANDDRTIIENCRNEVAVSANGAMANAAGFIAYAQSGELELANCLNAGRIVGSCAAGVVTQDRVSGKSTYTFCSNDGSGNVYGSSGAAGIVQSYQPGTSREKQFVFDKCSNRGTVRASGDNSAGGILGSFQGTDGQAYATGAFTSCFNSGTVGSGRNPGGIVGNDYAMPLSLAGCYNAGTVENTDNLFGAGGLIGALGYEGTRATTIASCYSSGVLKSRQGNPNGGLVGHFYAGAGAKVNNCYVLEGMGNATGFGGINQAMGAQKPVVTTGQATALPEADLKAAQPKLGDIFAVDDGDPQLNGGYPVCWWQKDGSSETRDLSEASVGFEAGYEYTGSAIEPDPQVAYRGTMLKRGSDYTVSYRDNTQVGTATAVITGRGRYTGTLEKSFKIVQADMAHVKVADIPAQWCTDRAATPALVLTNGAGVELVEGTDYTVAYAGNDHTNDSATATITGIGNYRGTRSVAFSVTRLENEMKGAGTKSDPYRIASARDFYYAAAKANAGSKTYAQANYELVADISLAQKDGEPAPLALGASGAHFTGSLDGKGHTVSLGIKTARPYQGIFGVTENASVRNLNVAGSVDQTLPEAKSGQERLGSVGALIGYAFDELTVENCTNSATVNTNGAAAAGFVGMVDSAGKTVTFFNCANAGAVTTSESCAGGFVGDSRAGKLVLEDCANTAPIAASRAAAGLVGRVGGSSSARTVLSIETSYNTRAITGANASAGLVGAVLTHTDVTARDCFNRGEIRPTSDVATRYLYGTTPANGGLVGTVASSSTLSIDGAYNVAAVKAAGGDDGFHVGGLVGALSERATSATISHALYADSCKSSVGLGGIAPDVLQDASASKTDAELRAEDTPHLMGEGFGYDLYGQNDGYPVVGAQRAPIAGCALGAIGDQRYTGAEVVPQVNVRDEAHGRDLVEGRDFKVVCKDNVERGTATAQVIGIGTYRGKGPVANFEIVPGSLGGDCELAPIAQQLLKDGKAEPATTVMNKASGVELKAGVDYDVTYADNTYAGADATVTLTGKGNYTGMLTGRFKVAPEGTRDIADSTVARLADMAFTGEAVTPKPVVAYGGKTLVEGTDYTLSYKDNVEIGIGTVTITGTGAYAGTRTASFRILAMDDLKNAVISAVGDQIYTGKAIEPELTMTIGGKTLVEGRDYQVKYSSNVKPGTAYATAEGINDYSGTKTIAFKIVKAHEPDEPDKPDKPINPGTPDKPINPGTPDKPNKPDGPDKPDAPQKADLSRASISAIADQTRTGKSIEPDPVVTLGDKRLQKGKDYLLSYSGNVEIGTARVYVTGIGDYTGLASASFKIVRAAEPDNSDTPDKPDHPSKPNRQSKLAAPCVGDTIDSGMLRYRVTAVTKLGGTVKVTGVSKKTSKAKAKKVVVPKSVRARGKSFKVVAIGSRAFKGARSLKSVRIQNGALSSIGAYAFYGCKKLSTFTSESKHLKSIGKRAFCGCKKLADVKIVSGRVGKVGSRAFSKISKKAKVRVPAKRVAKYKKLFAKGGLAKKAVVRMG